MNWGILEDVIAKSAPILGSLVGGPFGAIIGNFISHCFGIDIATPDALLTALSNDPDAGIKLKQLEFEHQDALQKMISNDTSDARHHEEVMEQHGMKWFVPSLAITIILGFILMTVFIALDKVDASEYQILYLLLGQLSAGFSLVLGFYFGSSNNHAPQLLKK